MRISTSTFFNSTASRLTEAQSSLARLQNQISSGARLLAPSDDPVAAARVIELSQQQGQDQQLAANRQSVTESLSGTDGVLGSVANLLQSVQDIAVNAGSGTLNDNDRKTMAATVNADLDQLLSLANTRDAAGNALFAGFRSNGAAFVKTASGVAYQGDQGRRMVQVDSAQQMAANLPGDRLFQGGGNDAFKALSDLAAVLSSPVNSDATRAALSAGLKTAAATLSGSLENVIMARASVGSNLQQLGLLDTSGAAQTDSVTTSLAQLQDLDYNVAVTELTRQKTALEAAQASFAKIGSMSLFDYIN